MVLGHLAHLSYQWFTYQWFTNQWFTVATGDYDWFRCAYELVTSWYVFPTECNIHFFYKQVKLKDIKDCTVMLF